MARTLAVVLAEIRVLVQEATDLTPIIIDPDPEPTGLWYIGDADIFIGNSDFYVGGGQTGGVTNPITLTVGGITAGMEGSGGITLTVGAITPAGEGSGGTITLTVGGITSASESNPAQAITLTVGAINPAAEGN